MRVFVWPSWNKPGSDVYCSSRWGETYQIFDLYWTPKSQWRKSKTYDWVFIQEIPFDPATGEFVWSAAKDPTERRVSWLRWMQKVRYIENKKRGESDSEQE